MATYKVTDRTTLNRDGKEYRKGDSIELDPSDAKPLLATGTIEAPKGRPPKAATDEPTETALDRLTRDELDDMAAELDIENPDELPNKGAVIEAIEAAKAATDEG